MIIGVPRETHHHEHRVGLTPYAVRRLVAQGHSVLVEQNAGLTAHFHDSDYHQAGAQPVFSPEEVYRRSDIICSMSRLARDELDYLKSGLIICGFHHLAVESRDFIQRLAELETTMIGYEIIADDDGDFPVRAPFSEMGGQMAVQLAGHYLQNEHKGRGVLLGSVPGVPPPTMLIIGGGRVGFAAARQGEAAGAHVIVLDSDMQRLRRIHQHFCGRVVTALLGSDRLEKWTAIADVIIGAVSVGGGRTPFIVTEDMVRAMRPGSVIIDVSIDQGGCVETARPTTLDDPTFIAHDVIHHCVPYMTANVARTASRALANVALDYILALANDGLDAALAAHSSLRRGLYLYKGKMVNERAAITLGMPAEKLELDGTGR